MSVVYVVTIQTGEAVEVNSAWSTEIQAKTMASRLASLTTAKSEITVHPIFLDNNELIKPN